MKKVNVFLLITMAIASVSCVTHYFSQPQPVNAKTVYTMPEEIQGTWNTNDNEEVVIDKTSWVVISVDSLGIKSSKKEFEVSDSLVIKKWRKNHYFNILESNGYYTIYVGCNRKGRYTIKSFGDIDTLTIKNILNVEPDKIENKKRYYDSAISKRKFNRFVNKGGFCDTLMQMDLKTRRIIK